MTGPPPIKGMVFEKNGMWYHPPDNYRLRKMSQTGATTGLADIVLFKLQLEDPSSKEQIKLEQRNARQRVLQAARKKFVKTKKES